MTRIVAVKLGLHGDFSYKENDRGQRSAEKPHQLTSISPQRPPPMAGWSPDLTVLYISC